MNVMHIRRVDLNLLPILTAVVEDGSVSVAAEKLGMTQSAVSQALSRMRKLCKDPLLVRTGSGMRATPYALELTRKFRPALESLSAALAQPVPFDPVQASRSYTISISGGGDDIVVPAFMRLLSREAPDISLSTLAAGPADLEKELEDGRVNLVIDYMLVAPGGKAQSPRYSRALRFAKVVEEDLVVLDAESIASQTPITLETYAARSYVGFTLPVSRARILDRSLARQGVRRDIRFRMPTIASIPAVVESTGSLATIPARFAAKCEQRYAVKACVPDFPLPRIALFLVWHAQTQNDPAELWFRERLMSIIARPERVAISATFGTS